MEAIPDKTRGQHSETGTMTCEECSKTFSTSEALEQHGLMAHDHGSRKGNQSSEPNEENQREQPMGSKDHAGSKQPGHSGEEENSNSPRGDRGRTGGDRSRTSGESSSGQRPEGRDQSDNDDSDDAGSERLGDRQSGRSTKEGVTPYGSSPPNRGKDSNTGPDNSENTGHPKSKNRNQESEEMQDDEQRDRRKDHERKGTDGRPDHVPPPKSS